MAHAPRLRNDMGLQAHVRPARETRAVSVTAAPRGFHPPYKFKMMDSHPVMCKNSDGFLIQGLHSIRPGKERIVNTTAATVNSRFRILLVDDNEDSKESTSDLLKIFDYDVRTASDGNEALKLALEFEPHLVLSDIGLPGMSGYQLAPALRQAAANRRIVIAAVTGYGLASDRMYAQEVGFDHHLVKPLDAETLLEFVARQAASLAD